MRNEGKRLSCGDPEVTSRVVNVYEESWVIEFEGLSLLFKTGRSSFFTRSSVIRVRFSRDGILNCKKEKEKMDDLEPT